MHRKQHNKQDCNFNFRHNKHQDETRRDKECFYVQVKGTIQEEVAMVINTRALNTEAHFFIKQILLNIKYQLAHTEKPRKMARKKAERQSQFFSAHHQVQKTKK